VAKYLNTVPNRISLSGHTDDKPYNGVRGYSNWELSADRANAARRALLDGGLESHKIARVVGLASSVLFDRENPYNPINRRISLIVMTRSAEAEALSTDAADVDATRQQIESAEPVATGAPPAAAAIVDTPAAMPAEATAQTAAPPVVEPPLTATAPKPAVAPIPRDPNAAARAAEKALAAARAAAGTKPD
jgi:chemotaxis protein MotB